MGNSNKYTRVPVAECIGAWIWVLWCFHPIHICMPCLHHFTTYLKYYTYYIVHTWLNVYTIVKTLRAERIATQCYRPGLPGVGRINASKSAKAKKTQSRMLPLLANLAQVVRDSAEAAIQRYCVVSNIFDDRQLHPLCITRVTVTLCTCKFQIVEYVGYYNKNFVKCPYW